MTNLLKGAAATVLPLLLITGCANHSNNDFKVGSVNHTYKTQHPIVIDEKEKTLDVPVPSSSYDLPRAAASAIEGFAAEFRTAANGYVTIMVPSGSPNEAAARTISSKVSETLSKSGVPTFRQRMTTYHAAEHGSSAPIRLSYSAVSANVETCGKWTEDLAGKNTENRNYHNFGCASQNNTAAMIANPADLLAPRGMTPVDAERRNTVIDNYREGDVGSTTAITSVFE